MLPTKIKAEVKLTTGGGVSLAARELDALAALDPGALGLLAVLFVGDDRELDGRWTIVDATAFTRRNGASVSAVRTALAATARVQGWLDPLRCHVDELWPSFLQAFIEVAERGHTELVSELDALHRAGRLRDRLPRHRVLAIEHLAAVNGLVRRHGESEAGRLVQDLMAYLLALAGYRRVTLNPVGVPDFELDDCALSTVACSTCRFALPRSDAERLVALCRGAGDERLAAVIEARMPLEW